MAARWQAVQNPDDGACLARLTSAMASASPAVTLTGVDAIPRTARTRRCVYSF